MKIKGMSLGPLGTNCYIVYDGNEALIFDPGGDMEQIIGFLNDHDLEPLAIMLTHAHFDHIGAVDGLRKHFGIDVYLHDEESTWLEDPMLNRSGVYFGEDAIQTAPPEQSVQVGNLTIGPFAMEVLHTPGHSPGSVTYVFHQENWLISGDVLFHNGMGRTDLPGGSLEVLIQSIAALYAFPDEFYVYAGHNIPTTIGQEKYNNPYTLQFLR